MTRTPTTRALLAPLALLTLGLGLSACGDKEEPDDDTGSATGGGEGGGDEGGGEGGETGDPEPVTPTEGEWTSDGGTTEEDTCQFEDEGGSDTGGGDDTSILTMTGEATFTVVSNDGETDLDCTLTDDLGSFTCEPTNGGEERTDFAEYGLDAVLILQSSVWGSLESSTAGSLYIQVDASCEGEDCGTVEEYGGVDLPCMARVVFQIAYAGG